MTLSWERKCLSFKRLRHDTEWKSKQKNWGDGHTWHCPRSGANFRNMLKTLGPDNCLQLLLMILTEQKIMIHSLRPDVLTSVTEALMQIIFPLHWQYTYIPLLPVSMSGFLESPQSFLFGLDSKFFDVYDPPGMANDTFEFPSTLHWLPLMALKENPCPHQRRQFL